MWILLFPIFGLVVLLTIVTMAAIFRIGEAEASDYLSDSDLD